MQAIEMERLTGSEHATPPRPASTQQQQRLAHPQNPWSTQVRRTLRKAEPQRPTPQASIRLPFFFAGGGKDEAVCPCALARLLPWSA